MARPVVGFPGGGTRAYHDNPERPDPKEKAGRRAEIQATPGRQPANPLSPPQERGGGAEHDAGTTAEPEPA